MINIILSMKRHVIYTSRNYTLHENKKTDRWTLFKNLIKQHTRTIYTANIELFQKVFADGAEIVKIT